MVPPDFHGAAENMPSASLRFELVELIDCGSLGDRHIVEYAECADDHAGEQKPADVDARHVHEDLEVAFIAEAADVRGTHGKIGQDGGEGKGKEGATHRGGGLPAEAVDEEEDAEKHRGPAGKGQEDGGAALGECGQEEDDDDEHRDRQSNECAQAPQCAHQHDQRHCGSQPYPHGNGAVEVLE